MGYFIGRIGRSRVCTLYAQGVELPSDLMGIMYIPLDADGNWELELMSELVAAGICCQPA